MTRRVATIGVKACSTAPKAGGIGLNAMNWVLHGSLCDEADSVLRRSEEVPSLQV